jgi:hypothetical protein
MSLRVFPLLTALSLLAAPAARAADAEVKAPTLLIRIESIGDLRNDVKYLAKLVGQEEKSTEADSFLDNMIGEKGLEGIDIKRPLGLYVYMTPEFMDSSAVALIPVVDDKAVLDFFDRFNLKAEKDDGGIYTLSSPMLRIPVPVYLRFANKYAYITAQSKKALSKDKLLDPEKVLEAGKNAMFYGLCRLDQIPESMKQIALSAIERHLDEESRKHESGESQADHELKSQVLKNAAEHTAALIKEGSDLQVSFNLNRKAQELVGELRFAGKQGSSLRTGIADLAQSQSLFGGFPSEGSALRVIVHAALPESVRNALGPVIDEKIKEGLAKEKDEHKAETMKKVARAIEPTLKSGALDVGVSVLGPSSKGHYSLVVGVRVKDGKSIDSALQEGLKDLPAAEQDKIKDKIHWNAEKIDGVSVHRLDVGKDLDEDARRKFGDNPFYLAFRDDALFIVGGEDGLQILKAALSAEPKVSPEVQLNLSVARFAPFSDKKHGPDLAKAASSVFGDNPGGDQVEVTIAGGDALTIRLRANAAVLKFMHKAHEKEHSKRKAPED